MFQMWIEIFLFVFLGICAVCDSIEKKVPLAVVWLGIIAAVLLRIQGSVGNGTWQAAALSVIPGAAFWILGFISGEKVGYGDGWMLVMIGLFVGIWKCFLILMAALILGSTVILVLLVSGRATRDYQVPFAPFLLLGMGVVVCL